MYTFRFLCIVTIILLFIHNSFEVIYFSSIHFYREIDIVIPMIFIIQIGHDPLMPTEKVQTTIFLWILIFRKKYYIIFPVHFFLANKFLRFYFCRHASLH